jgi:hypothetical protein
MKQRAIIVMSISEQEVVRPLCATRLFRCAARDPAGTTATKIPVPDRHPLSTDIEKLLTKE